ncbi:hypothetical protein [Nocardia pseudovaccinii]|uniref:hypothetical protein n=1 Tax=Nocardia pseudovaccinii TaxID=189540 RepID=UPI0007A43479|nr:hypothetical protein [Nocardia pseudovaccinii]
MEQHSFKLELPSSTSFAAAEAIALKQIVFPHMARTGQNSYADLAISGRRMGSTAGMSIFTGTYLL